VALALLRFSCAARLSSAARVWGGKKSPVWPSTATWRHRRTDGRTAGWRQNGRRRI